MILDNNFKNRWLIIGICLLSLAQTGASAERVLSIGNSLINRNDTPGMFDLMATEAGKGLRWTEQYWSGRSLAQHFSVSETQVTSAKYVVSHTAWDYIILQEFSSTGSSWIKTFTIFKHEVSCHANGGQRCAQFM